MIKVPRETILRCLALLLRPVASFCVRNSLRIQDLSECCKLALMQAAKSELEKKGARANTSKLSVMTGLQRREVMRLEGQEAPAARDRNWLSKIMGHWQTERRFTTKSREPRALTFGSDDSDFSQLVKGISRDLNPAAVLFELERVGAVEKRGSRLHLVRQSYVPKGDVIGGFNILAEDSEDLVAAVEQNLFSPAEVLNLHARTYFDRVHADAVPEIKRWLLQEGHNLHAKAREIIAKHDQDINPCTGKGSKFVKVTLGSFSFVKED
ncbi:MAG: hypothetical protein DCC75_01325 [Proteobacteria bacterium]|nr:MAG: hypothetical protein DCC75_01325 [Pseudomonadota bacterium]